MTRPSDTTGPDVADFLRENPNWLAENADLYRVLAPPRRVHGEPLADHMAAMLGAERAHAASLAQQTDDLLTAKRAGAGLASRVQDAVLALIAAPDPIAFLTHDLPALLGMDAVSLCAEAAPNALAHARPLPPGEVDRLLGPRAVLVREQPTDTILLHGEAAALATTDALVRVPLTGPPALLALASRTRATLHPNQGEAALAYLGRAIAAAIQK